MSERPSECGIRHVLIGGIALQAWGEPRVTRDVDVAALVGFGDEREKIETMLREFPPRTANALEHALVHRVLLCVSPEGIGIDIGLAAFPFEEAATERSTYYQFLPEVILPIIGPEDLIIMKVFAGRPQDWIDVRGILVRQGGRLDWGLIESTLPELLDLIEKPERLERLAELRSQA